jgi:colanic acid biosynthesis glycosyl transferase WcaI
MTTAAMAPHLLVFNRSYHPDLGATGQLVTQLCEDLVARHGWAVTVVAGRPTVTLDASAALGDWGPVRSETVRGVRILRAAGTRLPKTRFAGRVTNYVTYFAAAAIAGSRACRPDVVMSLTDPPILGLAALAWARRWRVPFVFLCQDIFPEVALLLEDFRNERVNRALDRINRLLLRKAAAVVAIGETMARRLVELKGADPATVAVIHNWADRTVLGPEPRRNPFAQAYGLLDRFVVLHSGNLGLSQGSRRSSTRRTPSGICRTW